MNIERVWGCVFAASLAFAIVLTIVFIIALGVALRVTFGGAA